MRKLPIFELFIEDTDQVGLALVGAPAIESDFMFFNEEPIKMSFNEDKMMIKGPALIPNKLIYRNDMLGERYIYFSEETIIKFVETLMSKTDNKFNIGHTDVPLNATLIESYFASEVNEFNVPANSWIVGLKVKDLEAWNRIKSGEFKGYSVEGLFSNQLVNLMTNKKEESMNLKEKIMSALNSVIFPEEVKLEDTPIVDEPVVDEPVEEEEELSVDEKLQLMKEEILIEVDKRIEAMVGVISEEVSKVDEKVEEFGKQPVDNKKTTEEVAIPKQVTGSRATQFFSK